MRHFLTLLFFSCPFLLIAQVAPDDLLPSETIAGAVTKSMQGGLELTKEQLEDLRLLNEAYAAELAQLRRRSAPGQPDADQLQRLLEDWQLDLRELLSPSQHRAFERMQTERLRELQLAGLHRHTARLATALDLDTDQIAQVEALHAEYFPQMIEVQQGGDPARIKDRRLRGIQSSQELALQEILTPAQWQRYQELREELVRQLEQQR